MIVLTLPMNRLSGIELISCATSVASRGLEEAAFQCGYGEDTQSFLGELKTAGKAIGMDIHSVQDLVTDQDKLIHRGGVEVAPDSGTQL